MATGEIAIGADGLPVVKVGPWAKEKLEYVKRYCHIFNVGMKDKWGTRTYIDLFSGAGRCLVETTNDEIDGSALIALQAQPPFTHYFFNDMEPRAIRALERRAAGFKTVSLQFFNEDCNNAIEEIAKKLPERALHFCFIDPTNWQIRFTSIQKLSNGRRVDLAITFHTGQIKRVALDAPKLLDDFFGDSSWSVKYKEMQASGKREGSRVLLDAYEEKLKGLGYKDIRDWIIEKNRKGVPLYHLLFASKHPRGKEFWDKISQKLPSGQIRLGL